MIKKNFNETPHFPYTYGELLENDGKRVSDRIVNLVKNKKFQSCVVSVLSTIFTLGSYARPASAIPIEYGEAANQVLQNANQGQAVPELGNAAVQQAQQMIPPNPIPEQLQQVGQAGRVNFNPPPPPPIQPGQPVKVPAWRIPPPPVTAMGQYANTAVLIGAVGWICLNGAWGNPIFMAGCIGVITGLVNEGRKIIFK